MAVVTARRIDASYRSPVRGGLQGGKRGTYLPHSTLFSIHTSPQPLICLLTVACMSLACSLLALAGVFPVSMCTGAGSCQRRGISVNVPAASCARVITTAQESWVMAGSEDKQSPGTHHALCTLDATRLGKGNALIMFTSLAPSRRISQLDLDPHMPILSVLALLVSSPQIGIWRHAFIQRCQQRHTLHPSRHGHCVQTTGVSAVLLLSPSWCALAVVHTLIVIAYR